MGWFKFSPLKEKREAEPPQLTPEALASLAVLSPSQQGLVIKLVALGQADLFEGWKDSSPEDRCALASQLEDLDNAYPAGGLEGYMENARKLLDSSKKGLNPLEGWVPSVSEKGQFFEVGTKEYGETEAIGMEELCRVGFVLVAGGLGERLG